MYDVTAGSVRVDDVDVRDYDTEQLWSAIGLVPQRGYLFSGTVADNLRYGKADATDDEMWEALRVAVRRRLRPRPRRRARHAGRAGRHQLLGRAAAATGDRARRHPPARHLPVRRRVLGARRAHRRAGACRAERGVRRRHRCHRGSQRISTVAAADQIIVIDDGRSWAPGRTSRCWPTAPPTPSSPTRSRSAPASGAADDRAAGTPDPRAWCRRPRSAPATSRAQPSAW